MLLPVALPESVATEKRENALFNFSPSTFSRYLRICSPGDAFTVDPVPGLLRNQIHAIPNLA
jgi:hypothetical protein